MSHVRIPSEQFADLISYLRKAEAEARLYTDDRRWASAAGHLLGTVNVQLINMEILQQFHTHDDIAERPVFRFARDVATPEVDLVGEVNDTHVLS